MTSEIKQTVLITGASSGIGHATAVLFAQRGWNVIATLRDPNTTPDTVEELKRLAADTDAASMLVTRLDVQDQKSIDDAISEAIAKFGRIDVLVNSAGYGQYGLFEIIPKESVREQFDVNLFGLMDVTRSLVPHFRENKSGTIINIGCGAGMYGMPMSSVYCASKFALEGFTEALSYELEAVNIRVKMIVPHGGVSDTRFGTRAIGSLAPNQSLDAYTDFERRTATQYAKLAMSTTTLAKDVAQIIYGAVTDGTDKFRHLIGDDRSGFIKARTELTEDKYFKFMHNAYAEV